MKERKQYSVGIYCRLSKDDIGSGDSSSILSHVIMWLFFAFILIIGSIPFLHFSWRETACEERILRKLNEIDKYHDVSFS